jgi:hypothetical protein
MKRSECYTTWKKMLVNWNETSLLKYSSGDAFGRNSSCSGDEIVCDLEVKAALARK